MEPVGIDKQAGLPEVWKTYQTVIKAAEGREVVDVTALLAAIINECCVPVPQ